MTQLHFRNGTDIPDIKPGTMEDCIVVTENENGGQHAYAAYYLNAYPLEHDECTCDSEHDDGCPTTGWFYDSSNFEYDNCYFAINAKVLYWAPIPSAADILASRPQQGTDT